MLETLRVRVPCPRRARKQRTRRWTWTWTLALALGAVPPLAAQIRLPDMGDPSAAVLSAGVERRLGEAFMREIRASTTIVDDPEIEDYVQAMGYSLTSASDQSHIGFNFFVVKNPAINAFAAPGGWIGVHSGLILAAESESELAAVLAHEIAHVTQRHIARQVALNERSNIATLAGILAAIAIGTQSAEAGQAAAAAVLGTQAQNRLDFSRANEREADRVGIQLLEASGFDPAAMASFFEKLQNASRYYRKPPEFLSTHPVTTTRIAEARDRAARLGFKQRANSVDFALVSAKLRVMTEPDSKKLIEYLVAEIDKRAPAPSTGLRYGLALAQIRAGKLAEARTELRRLVAENPNSVPLRVALAETLAKAGESGAALAAYDDLYRLFPDSRLVVRSYCSALLILGEPRKVTAILAEYERLTPLDAEMQRQRAQALESLGRTAESQAALAEHYYIRGELDLAIHQLTLASQHPNNDFYRASRIDARLRDIRGEQEARAQR